MQKCLPVILSLIEDGFQVNLDVMDKLLLAGSQDMQAAKLVLAINEGRISVAEQLLEMGVADNPTGYYDEEGFDSALIAAAKGGHLSLVEELIKQGSAIDFMDWDDKTARDHAVIKGHAAIVARLDRALAEDAAAAEAQGEWRCYQAVPAGSALTSSGILTAPAEPPDLLQERTEKAAKAVQGDGGGSPEQ